MTAFETLGARTGYIPPAGVATDSHPKIMGVGQPGVELLVQQGVQVSVHG